MCRHTPVIGAAVSGSVAASTFQKRFTRLCVKLHSRSAAKSTISSWRGSVPRLKSAGIRRLTISGQAGSGRAGANRPRCLFCCRQDTMRRDSCSSLGVPASQSLKGHYCKDILCSIAQLADHGCTGGPRSGHGPPGAIRGGSSFQDRDTDHRVGLGYARKRP